MPPVVIEAVSASIGGELAFDRPVVFEIVVEGREDPVEAEIVGLTYRIVREAMLNAVRHAERQSIGMTVPAAIACSATPRRWRSRLLGRSSNRMVEPGPLKRGRPTRPARCVTWMPWRMP